ncbi:hypothetical protein NPX13_g7755 [Xylaria arbuscula]|uniref:Uncharacterized protein n=1 Tax=Xylaria arbuscula TaxID=114810 RepID=A0A9W8NA32_9PEZI|nr:hypothetical protein NPX13_g7755 [Xylaria arbuscula]
MPRYNGKLSTFLWGSVASGILTESASWAMAAAHNETEFTWSWKVRRHHVEYQSTPPLRPNQAQHKTTGSHSSLGKLGRISGATALDASYKERARIVNLRSVMRGRIGHEEVERAMDSEERHAVTGPATRLTMLQHGKQAAPEDAAQHMYMYSTVHVAGGPRTLATPTQPSNPHGGSTADSGRRHRPVHRRSTRPIHPNGKVAVERSSTGNYSQNWYR